MPAKKDPRVDDYIAESAAFARPILKHLRAIVHAGCPDVQETIKWRMPHFDYKGLFIGMAAFKQHCAFGFWREAALALGGTGEERDSMGQFGRITSLADLPDKKTLIGYVRKAAELKDAGVKSAAKRRPGRLAAAAQAPEYLMNRLKRDAKARKSWEAFSPSHRKEYIEWLTAAKREETREQRLEKTLAQLSVGKSLNWRYQRT